MKQKRMAVLFLVTCMLAGCDYNERVGIEETMTEPVTETNDMSAQWKEASTTPFGRYPQTVTYTLAKEITEDNSKLPLGESYEDNAYTRLIREVINAQNQDVYENSGDSYYNGVYMMVTSGEIADVMVVSEEIMYQMQEKGMLEDLTDAYAQCASEKIKEIYESYGGEIFGNCTFGKRIMAVPETNISNGPNLCWVRKDYLDKLGLDKIYIQAKRYKLDNTVGKPQIQQFSGALDEQKATKGVFITTSSYSKEAKQYVQNLNKKIVLIDGQELARYMIEYNVGVSTKQVYEVKRIDSDYFEE